MPPSWTRLPHALNFAAASRKPAGVVDLRLEAGVVEVAGGGAQTGVLDDAAQLGWRMTVGDGIELDLREADLMDGAKNAGEILRGLAAHHVELNAVDEPALSWRGEGFADAAKS